MQRLIGTAACSTAADCRTIAIGAKLCGGPARYVAYSLRGLDEPAFRSVVTELNQLHRALADVRARSGMVSDCSVVVDPGAVCQSGHCLPGE